jgi:hypothetical protein
MIKKPSTKSASNITIARDPDENEPVHHFVTFMNLLKEERELNIKKTRYEELLEGLRQLEWSVLKLEAEEKGNLHALNLQWHEKRLKAAALSDHERELKEFTRHYHKLKNLQNQLMQITEKGLYEKATVERIDYEIKNISLAPDRVMELQQLADSKSAEMQRLRSEYILIEEQIKKMEPVLKQITLSELMISEAKKAEHESQSLQEEIEKIKNLLAKQTYAKRELLAMDDLKKQIKANGYDPSAHREIRQSIDHYLEVELPKWLKEGGLIP